MKNKKSSRGIFVDVAVLPVCLVIASSCLASGMFAKFVSSSGIESESARVASFNVGAKLDQTAYTVDLNDKTEGGKTVSYTVELSNKSDAAVSYTIVLTFNDEVKDFIAAELDGKSAQADESGEVFVWENAGTLDPHTLSKSLVLKLIIDGAPEDGEYNFNVNVTFTQID